MHTTIDISFSSAIFCGKSKISCSECEPEVISNDNEKSFIGSLPIVIFGETLGNNRLALSIHSSHFDDVCLIISVENNM